MNYSIMTSTSPFTNITCSVLQDCYPDGFCQDGYCQCNACYLNDDGGDGVCAIHLIHLLAPFLISLFLGGCGIDHCFMSGCTCPGICIGIIKALTLGGLSIWYIVDVVFFATGNFDEQYNVSGYQLLCDDW